MDPLEQDILQALLLSKNTQLRWKELFETVYSKHEKRIPSKKSFKTMLIRKVDKLRRSGNLTREKLSHKQVFYSISPSNKKTVESLFLRAFKDETQNSERSIKLLSLLSSNLNPKKVKDRFNTELAAVEWDSIRKRDAEKRSNPPVLDGIKNPEIIKEIMDVWEENKKIEHPLVFPINEAPVLKALSDICQSLHKIRCGIYTNNSDGKDYVTAITSNGVYLFPEKNLEGLNLDILTIFPLSKARNIPFELLNEEKKA